MKLSLIVAVAHDNVIGVGNTLPWHLPEDLAYFKATTLGKPVIMGRKTFESIGRLLPGRPNIVITRQEGWRGVEGLHVVHSVDEAIAKAENLVAQGAVDGDEAMIIGGAEIYRSALPLADRVYLTEIDLRIEGDAWFPALKDSEWTLVSDVAGKVDACYPHRFKTFHALVEK